MEKDTAYTAYVNSQLLLFKLVCAKWRRIVEALKSNWNDWNRFKQTIVSEIKCCYKARKGVYKRTFEIGFSSKEQKKQIHLLDRKLGLYSKNNRRTQKLVKTINESQLNKSLKKSFSWKWWWQTPEDRHEFLLTDSMQRLSTHLLKWIYTNNTAKT